MKNKKLTYLLGFAVIVIWGMIIYKVVQTFSAGDDDAVTLPSVIRKEPYNDYALPTDTAKLLLNYRDPFGMVKFKDTTKMISHLTKEHFIAKAKPDISWAFIKYAGYIRNPGSKQLITLLQINGKSVDMKEGDVIDQVQLIKNMQDSIKVRFSGQTKFITIQHR